MNAKVGEQDISITLIALIRNDIIEVDNYMCEMAPEEQTSNETSIVYEDIKIDPMPWKIYQPTIEVFSLKL